MADKQIIDRVNVKECKYYCNGKCERYEEFVEADYANYSVKCICEKENDLGTYDICDYQQLKAKEQECEELKKINKHIDHNRKQKADKLMRIEKLIIACSTGYTDEFIQELLVILHEPEPIKE